MNKFTTKHNISRGAQLGTAELLAWQTAPAKQSVKSTECEGWGRLPGQNGMCRVPGGDRDPSEERSPPPRCASPSGEETFSEKELQAGL